MTGAIRVRPATVADAHPLACILGAIVAEPHATAIDRRLPPAELADWFIVGDHVVACAVAERAGAALGFQAIERFHELPEGWADIGTYVDAPARGAGVGRALLAANTAAARAAGITRVRAVIGEANERAVAFYRACGFRPLEDTERHLAVDGCRTLALEIEPGR